jgi:hypothetical protein
MQLSSEKFLKLRQSTQLYKADNSHIKFNVAYIPGHQYHEQDDQLQLAARINTKDNINEI